MTPTLDTLVERAGRWTAARSTRRSFLGRAGRLAVLVASGPAVAVLLADEAEARVCGQSGVSPKCPTFDCDEIWGWCWYANGCCAGGLLKKICDCCGFDYPNVHGYCPTSYNVKCIVESCGTDPRLQTVALARLDTDEPASVAAAANALRFPNGSPVAVLADAADPLFLAVAVPLAAVLGAPLLPVPRAVAGPGTLAALSTLRVTQVVIAGGLLPSGLDSSLISNGYGVERVGTAVDIGPFSQQVATRIRQVNGAARTVCVVAAGTSLAAAPLAGAYGAARGHPVVVGTDQAFAAQTPTLFVGPEAAAHAGEVGGAEATTGATLPALAAELADRAVAAGSVDVNTIVVASRTSPGLGAAGAFGGPVVLHEPGLLDGARDWLYQRQATYGRAARAYAIGATGRLADPGVLELQSILNGYETRLLVGVAGQGLPVIPQPEEERCIGCARIAGSSKQAQKQATAPPPAYWGARAAEAGRQG